MCLAVQKETIFETLQYLYPLNTKEDKEKRAPDNIVQTTKQAGQNMEKSPHGQLTGKFKLFYYRREEYNKSDRAESRGILRGRGVL